MSPASSLAAAKATSGSANAADPAIHPARDAFDRIATCYDDNFTDSLIGRLQREAVWRHLGGLLRAGDRILDLGCGTGADAMLLARRGMEVEALDVSQQMIAEARRKIDAEGLAGRITTSVLAMEDLGAWDRQSCLSIQPSRKARESETTESDRQDCLSHLTPFDAAISNFGAINCVQHLRPVALALGGLIRPGGHVVVGAISRFCLWEAVFYSLQGRVPSAARRWSNGGRVVASLGASAGFTVYYRPVHEIVEAFRPEFRLRRHSGVGVLVPPTYLEAHARRFPKLMRLAARIDQSIAAWPVCRAAADHTLLVFRRERLT